ncbi:MAG: methyltransferase domain-containing protein [Magnetococcales bacterium]|nr:methyltransferase domain-containing protein [Magnetococcales bacterium]MBF0116790.1 methyltransferase domain-containing protein [Magnetococcales bacterium]
MSDPFAEKLYQIWEKRWQDSDRKERVTGLGLRMFRAKNLAIRKLLPVLNPSSIIDIGCGLGHILEVYQQSGYPCEGIDISPTAVHVCRNKGLRVELKNVEEETRTFDLVSSDGMLEHFLNFEPMARQLMRLSRRHVLIVQPNHDSFFGKTLPYLSELIKGDSNVREYNYRIADFIDVFERSNFRVAHNLPVFLDVFRVLVFVRQDPV